MIPVASHSTPFSNSLPKQSCPFTHSPRVCLRYVTEVTRAQPQVRSVVNLVAPGWNLYPQESPSELSTHLRHYEYAQPLYGIPFLGVTRGMYFPPYVKMIRVDTGSNLG